MARVLGGRRPRREEVRRRLTEARTPRAAAARALRATSLPRAAPAGRLARRIRSPRWVRPGAVRRIHRKGGTTRKCSQTQLYAPIRPRRCTARRRIRGMSLESPGWWSDGTGGLPGVVAAARGGGRGPGAVAVARERRPARDVGGSPRGGGLARGRRPARRCRPAGGGWPVRLVAGQRLVASRGRCRAGWRLKRGSNLEGTGYTGALTSAPSRPGNPRGARVPHEETPQISTAGERYRIFIRISNARLSYSILCSYSWSSQVPLSSASRPGGESHVS